MLRCKNSTTLEDFTDGILVDSIPSDRLENVEIGKSMDSDQVDFELFIPLIFKPRLLRYLLAPLCMNSNGPHAALILVKIS